LIERLLSGCVDLSVLVCCSFFLLDYFTYAYGSMTVFVLPTFSLQTLGLRILASCRSSVVCLTEGLVEVLEYPRQTRVA
jgi:hypothetical protein